MSGPAAAFYEALLAPLRMRPGFDDGTVVGFFGPDPGSLLALPGPTIRGPGAPLGLSGSRIATWCTPFTKPPSTSAPRSSTLPGSFPNTTSTTSGHSSAISDGHNIEAVCREAPSAVG